MQIVIVGAGAMGSLFAGLLAETGNQVLLVGRDEAHLAAIRDQGLRLETDAGDRRVRLDVARPAEATTIADLLLVYTKTRDTAAALAGVRHLIGPETFVLSLQNGLGNAEALASVVPQDRILVGVTTCPADRAGPGHVRSHGASKTRLGCADGVMRPIASHIAEALDRAGLPCAADPRVQAAIWEKAAFNSALNSMAAVTGCSVDQLGAVADGRELAQDIASEVVAVARASGIDADVRGVHATINHAIDHHHGHKASMLVDILAGRRTEIESLNGAVVAAAERLGVAVPKTRTLLALVRLVEARVAGGAAARQA
jgi:2-dehydropantoate 2-reductase